MAEAALDDFEGDAGLAHEMAGAVAEAVERQAFEPGALQRRVVSSVDMFGHRENRSSVLTARRDDGVMGRFDDDDGSLDPNESGGLWEYQLHPLTAEWLRQALSGLDDDLPVEVELYDGTGKLQKLRPMHIDLRGFEGRAETVVIVVR